jgi:hypothetical protein
MKASLIHEHMAVMGACGNRLGMVDEIDGESIKLTDEDSPLGQPHYIPMTWIDRVTDSVHLNRTCGAAKRDWETIEV